MRERPGALAGIGGTPLVRLSRLTTADDAEVWVKLEAANPTGSYKDRMALAMIEAAEERGELQPGQTVVEYTGGSTGSSLAFVCAVKGYPLRIVTSNAFAHEKLRTMAAFGAELEIIDSPDGIHPGLIPSMQARAKEIVAADGGFATDQFNNRDALVGYRTIGDEILEQLAGQIHAACIYVGVGGCLLGVTGALQERWPSMDRIPVEPDESAVLSGDVAGSHRIEGGGVGFVPPHLVGQTFQHVERVSTADAFAMARTAAMSEGVWTGPSGAANLVAALRTARRLGPGHRVVTVQPDSGLKYLAGDLYGGNVMIAADDPLANATRAAIQGGDVETLEQLLTANPTLTTDRIGDDRMSCTLLHMATDWPANFPNARAVIELLVARGVDVDGRFAGPHDETALHWAASSDDVEALDALLDAGADIEARGAVLGGGAPIADAVGFAQWKAARRLIERGATTVLWESAGLGLMDRVRAALAAEPPPTTDELTQALWLACQGGQLEVAVLLVDRGADVAWVGYDHLTPLDAAVRSEAHDVAAWLRGLGAPSVAGLHASGDEAST